MDAILTACIALAVWQGVMHLDTGKVRYLLGAALGMAMAFGTKGWIGVMVPFFAFGVLHCPTAAVALVPVWRFLLLLAAFALLSARCSMLTICSLMPIPNWQCGGRPASPVSVLSCGGKIFDRMGGTFGTTGANDPSSSSTPCCGRSCRGVSSFYVLLVKKVVEVSKGQSPASPVYWLTVPAILLTIAALSVSQFKLPHYLNVVFPSAIFVAAVLTEPKTERFPARHRHHAESHHGRFAGGGYCAELLLLSARALEFQPAVGSAYGVCALPVVLPDGFRPQHGGDRGTALGGRLV